MKVTCREAAVGGRNDSDITAAEARCTNDANHTEEFGGVTFFDESQLEPLRFEEDHRSASRLVRNMIAAGAGAGATRKRESIVRERLDEAGFDGMGYYFNQRQPDGSTLRGFLNTYAPPEWAKRYFSRRYHDIDPRAAKERRSVLPMVWDIAALKAFSDQRPSCAQARRFIDEMEDCGVRSGIFHRMVFVGAQPDEAVISLTSSEPSRRWIDDEVLGSALMLAHSINDYITGCVQLPKTKPKLQDATETGPSLPATQRAVLWHVANGLTDAQIAAKLCVSSHAIDYHLRQLRQRFSVRNRVQLVAATSHLLSN